MAKSADPKDKLVQQLTSEVQSMSRRLQKIEERSQDRFAERLARTLALDPARYGRDPSFGMDGTKINPSTIVKSLREILNQEERAGGHPFSAADEAAQTAVEAAKLASTEIESKKKAKE